MRLLKIIICLSLFFLSCTQKPKTVPEQIPVKSNEVLLPLLPSADSLSFTSGIRSILQDSKGNYWLGSHREGVCMFDGKTFRYFTVNEGLPNNQVRSIQEDKNGYIWVGTASGVASYDGTMLVNHTVGESDSSPKEDSAFLWFNAGHRPGVHRASGKFLHYLPFPLPLFADPTYNYGVTSIAKDRTGTVWIATYTALFVFDGKEMRYFAEIEPTLNQDDRLHIRSIFADSQGRVWIGNNGIGVLMLQNNIIVNFSRINGLLHPDSNKNGSLSPPGTLEHVFAITEDAKGNIWFGDRDTGAWKYNGTNLTNYTVDADLSTPMIWCIYEDKEKNLLFGMADGGVYRFEEEGFKRMF